MEIEVPVQQDSEMSILTRLRRTHQVRSFSPLVEYVYSAILTYGSISDIPFSVILLTLLLSDRKLLRLPFFIF